jgi:uncharacterized RDD family membrane protein YckC
MNDFEYVGFLPRAGAWAIDKLLVIALTSLMAWLYPEPGLRWHALLDCGPHFDCLRPQLPLLALALLRWLLPAFATVLFLTRLRATPGKLLLKAQVVDARSGASLSSRQAWARVLGCVASYATLGFGHLMIIFDARKQSLHDKIAGSVVIRPARLTVKVQPAPLRNRVHYQFRLPARRESPGHFYPVPPRRERTSRPTVPVQA